jgi:CDP-glucose 4,6-dehydratase
MLEALGVRDGWRYEQQVGLHETHALALDSTLARRVLGWSDRMAGRAMIEATGGWYRAWFQGEDMTAFSRRQIQEYETLA